MAERPRNLLVCSCEDTMLLDTQTVQQGNPGAHIETVRHLCRTEIERFRMAIATGLPLTVGCTQEAPLFSEVAETSDGPVVTYANIRETAGWSTDARTAGPKMAALLAAAAEPIPEVPLLTVASQGVILIYGRDERAIEAAMLLQEHLDVTVMITPPGEVPPPRGTEFPVARGFVRTAKGHFGGFEITVDEFAQPAPSSRSRLIFGPARNGAISRCDVILDLSGGRPFFSAPDLRDGYIQADPDDPTATLRAILKARDLVGDFEKPRYISFSKELCAHSRSKIVGCTRCLDLCPAGAIAPAGNHVVIDPHLCAGCGQCAAVCPTGAAAYTLPPADTLMRKLRKLLLTYRETGGVQGVVLVHDDAHGTPLIDTLARFGEGLPANTLPIAVNEITQIGLETVAAAFAYGASGLRFLLRERPRHDISGLTKTIELSQTILAGLGFGGDRIDTIETDDPEVLGARLRFLAPMLSAPRPATFLPVGEKRGLLRFALRELHRSAAAAVQVVALPQGAPLGKVEVDVAGCTLCLACVSACPTGALVDDPERPMLRFTEDACVQCGLCKATCPEKVIHLTPQIDFGAATATARVLKEEEPFCCIRCNKPFGVKSTVERVAAKLKDSHWMYSGGSKQVDLLRMCDSCRVAVVSEDKFDPYGPPRPPVRTSADYIREREEIADKDKS